MKKLIYIFLLILICFSCVNYDKGKPELFERVPNKDSELLNEYIWEFFDKIEKHDSNSFIHLKDSLFYLDSLTIENIKSYAYKGFEESFASLVQNGKKGKEICFSQLTQLKEYNVYAGEINYRKTNMRHWNYYLSVPVINKDSTKIMFYYEYYCGAGCAISSLVFMEKIDGKWVFKDEVIDWQS